MRRFLGIVLILLALGNISMAQSGRNNVPASPQNLPPVPDFSWVNSCAGDTTCFISQSIRGYSYTWTVWADSIKPPFNTVVSYVLYTNKRDSGFCLKFPHPGTYTVNLNAYDNHYANITKVITVDTVLKAVMDYQLCSNNFINNSLCASSFLWDFGDGTQSTAAYTTHQYADTGYYHVSLVAYKGSLSDTARKTIYVSAETYPNAGFNFTLLDSVAHFHATTTSKVGTFNWAFGDSYYATGKDTVHTYKDSTANYPVAMTSVNACGYTYGLDTVRVKKYVPEVNGNDNLVILPNIVQTNTYLEGFYNALTDARYLVSVYDAQGRKIYNAAFSFLQGVNQFRISTDGMAQGAYFLVMESGNSYMRRKFYVVNKP